ncbi:UNVERIFIED_CONTAM: LINE-1 reverse transcriptase [Sesamum latifolium]|uniref:LINE-1 reverse transcriptase n=1 Tax=Sesamum latifolium TaxID=2727402 RepID=A0AAW2WTY4_9LAMI
MYAVTRKLKALKAVFRAQRKKKGDLALNVKLAAEFLSIAQCILHLDRHNSLLLCLEACCRLIFLKATKLSSACYNSVPKCNGCEAGISAHGCSFGKLPSVGLQKGYTKSILRQEILTRTSKRSLMSLLASSISFLVDKAPGPEDTLQASIKRHGLSLGGNNGGSGGILSTWSLLKQVNATLLALIPKVQNPVTVADFRPISCCNVLYKAITKILVQRIRPLLSRLVSPTQNAFIQGRMINDNIFLAQELFAVYNQQRTPPRCAMKVDLQKAYDTVEWDFLLATLQLYGFPPTFIKWIEECVTTCSFSVCLNGTIHGFFGGARGLRQGDPMSPYLFVLVMEVLRMILQQLIEQDEEFTFHWKCRDIGLFQLSFADDLLLFSSVDESSVGLFHRGLQVFAGLSGLCANPARSQLIISKSAHTHREQLLHLLGFQEGTLSVRYLGLPLISSRLTLLDCQPLLQKIDKRIGVWVAFILPKGVIHQIEKRLRTFLWKGTMATGYAKVAWRDVCLPTEGGQGIRDIQALNYSLMCRRLWDIVVERSDSIWVKWIRHYRLCNSLSGLSIFV